MIQSIDRTNYSYVRPWWWHHEMERLSDLLALFTWWRHQMETFSALLVICAGNSPVSGEFPAQRPVTRSFDVFFYLRLNKRLGKQSWGWWFVTLSCPLWHQCNERNRAYSIYKVPVVWNCDVFFVTVMLPIILDAGTLMLRPCNTSQKPNTLAGRQRSRPQGIATDI